MAHCGKDKGELFLVVRDVTGLIRNFGHQDTIPFRIPLFQRGQVWRKLIAQNEDDIAGGGL
jgi:hypothetical protein